MEHIESKRDKTLSYNLSLKALLKFVPEVEISSKTFFLKVYFLVKTEPKTEPIEETETVVETETTRKTPKKVPIMPKVNVAADVKTLLVSFGRY